MISACISLLALTALLGLPLNMILRACVRACVHTRVCVRRYMAELVTLITVLILGREE